MVSIRTIATLGALAGAAYLVMRAGGPTRIGQGLGGGIAGFTSGITSGLGSAGESVSNLFSGWGAALEGITRFGQGSQAQNIPALGGASGGSSTSGQVVQELGLGANVEGSTHDPNEQLTPMQRAFLGVAGVFQSAGVGHDVNIQTGLVQYEGGLGQQDISQAYDHETGMLRVGTEGLSPATIEAQRRLAEQYGIITFDTTGAISNIGGYTAGS